MDYRNNAIQMAVNLLGYCCNRTSELSAQWHLPFRCLHRGCEKWLLLGTLGRLLPVLQPLEFFNQYRCSVTLLQSLRCPLKGHE